MNERALRLTILVLSVLVIGLATTLGVVLIKKDRPSRETVRTYSVTGTVGGTNCGGGGQLEFRDEDGTLVGTGQVGIDQDTNLRNCYSEFTAKVNRAEFYEISMNGVDLGSLSFDQMEAADWNLRLTL